MKVACSFGYVYFVEAIGAKRIKIGWTTRPPHWRLNDLTTSSPFPLELLKIIYGDYSTEQWWHQKFGDLRVHGEWFKARPSLRHAIAIAPAAIIVDDDGREAHDHARRCIAGLA